MAASRRSDAEANAVLVRRRALDRLRGCGGGAGGLDGFIDEASAST
jgi:hypothetical protein